MADARLDYILAGKDGIDWGNEPKADPARMRLPARLLLVTGRLFATGVLKA